jgi:YD repeat-containing protein
LKTASHTDPDNKNLTSSQLSDGAGRTVETTDPLGKIATMTYDDQSNLLTATDRDGNVTTNTYDAKNRLKTTEGDTGGIAAVTTTEYDATDNTVKITDAQGKVTVYTYDDANRKLTTTYAFGTPDATVWTQSYHPLGQIDTITKPNGITIEHTYENRELLASK